MAWVAVDKDGAEVVFESPIKRNRYGGFWDVDDSIDDGRDRSSVSLPIGSIEKLIGRVLTWDDEPVELYNENPN